ncbi:MAG: hypothetical protein ACXIUL_06000 [Wenzhouxiangella sp.]
MFGWFDNKKKMALEAERAFFQQAFILEQQKRLEAAGGKNRLDEETAIRFFAASFGEAAAQAAFGKPISSTDPDVRSNAVGIAFAIFGCHAACTAIGVEDGQPRARYLAEVIDCLVYSDKIEPDVLRQSLNLGQSLYAMICSNVEIMAELRPQLLRYRFEDSEQFQQFFSRVAREVGRILDESLRRE